MEEWKLPESGIFDTHAHYDDGLFDADRGEVLSALFESGCVCAVVNCGCDLKSSAASLELAHRYDGVFAAVGVHPHEAEKAADSDFERIAEMLSDEKAVALGEIGLDYHYDFSPREIQKAVFERQLAMAERLSVPVIVHDREAHADCLEAVLRHPTLRGVFHSFSGSAETALILQKAGWYVSFSGSVTFKGAKRLAEAAAAVADDRLLVETDCPYLTPAPFRGKRNHSGYIRYILERLAEIRGESYGFLETATRENAKKFFGIRS